MTHSNDTDRPTATTIQLPSPAVAPYPIQIARVLIEDGEGFQADLTPLYSVMDAKGGVHTFGAPRAGKVMDVLIKVGDIFTTRAPALNVRYFAVSPQAVQPAPKTAPATPTPTGAVPEPAKQHAAAQRDAPQANATPNAASRRNRKSGGLRGFGRLCLSVIVLAALAYGALQVLIFDETNKPRMFSAVLATQLFYGGTSQETSARGSAVVKIPTERDANGVMQYRDLRCELTRAQYDAVANQWQRIEDRNYARWGIWRSRVFRTLNCEVTVLRDDRPPLSDRLQSMSPGFIRQFLDDRFLEQLDAHDAGR